MAVGIDPGTTVAYAIFDLNGNLIHVNSKREMSKEELVKKISEFGKPCIISCDVSTPHDLVLKVTTIFNSRIFAPDYNLTEEEKKLLTKNYKYANEHERDAIASVVKTFHFFDNRFRQVEKIAKEKNLAEKVNELKFLIVSGVSLNNALLLFEKPEQFPLKSVETQQKQGARQIDIAQIIQTNAELKKALERLDKENLVLRERIKSLENGASLRLRKDKLVRAMELKIRVLEQLLRRKKEKKHVVLKTVPPHNRELDIDDLINAYREKRSSE